MRLPRLKEKVRHLASFLTEFSWILLWILNHLSPTLKWVFKDSLDRSLNVAIFSNWTRLCFKNFAGQRVIGEPVVSGLVLDDSWLWDPDFTIASK